MSHSKNASKLTDKCRLDAPVNENFDHDDEPIACYSTESRTYADFSVTVSKKSSSSGEDEAICAGQKSFISIHSTDHLCQVADIDNPANIEDCNVEVLSLNEVFPSTSEESLSNDDDTPMGRKKNKSKGAIQKTQSESAGKSTYVPTNSKSSTVSGRDRDTLETQASVYSDYNIPKSTMYVMGSNPGEPKMSYQDPPKKVSKTMKKFLRNIDKHKSEQMAKSGEKAISKLTTMRGILKDGGCGPECTGDSTAQDTEDNTGDTFTYQMECAPHFNYTKHGPDKNVSFNTQVLIIHFTGDLCVGQSIEALSKEKDQQARNSELRKTYLTKYNELWPTQK
ncbi:uncharacterized protein LOC123715494 isoform X1 [Pieris brassicae]|uniref:uncharacterized protein LOC123715494 isoform X1 n=1 Tax=Pieris brassicae TaxID=7116 RepID=UPI001E65EC0C|nr:uncharacterized protein LOC123715494 isoform X1 [Pieris brassicae]